MMNIIETLNKAVPVYYQVEGDFFRIMNADSNVNVTFYRAGKEIAEVENVAAGYFERFLSKTFDRVRIESTADNNEVNFVARLGNEVGYDVAPTGSVTVQNKDALNGVITNSQDTVTNVSGELLAANADRRYFLIQNTSDADYIRVRVDGGEPTAAFGIRIAPGDFLESSPMYSPTDQINAIAEGSDVDVEIMEG